MERLPVVNKCYQSWWELQCQIEDFYSEKERQRPPLSEQKGFRSIKNAVIQEAENLRLNRITFEDEAAEPSAPDLSELPYDCWELWMLTQDDTAPMKDRDEAAALLLEQAEGGNLYAQYLAGKLYQDGPVLIPDSVAALYWFEQAARQSYAAASYEMGNILLSHDPEVRDPVLGMHWLEYAAHNGSDCAAYRLGKEYLKGEVVEKDVVRAMGYLTQSANTENQYVQYALGKLYLEKRDQEQAHYWFNRAAAQGNNYAQFFLERWDSLKPPSVMLSISQLLHHMSRVFQEQTPASSVPGGIQVDRKRLLRLREKKIAMGHKPDDHEEQGYIGPTL